MRLDDDFEDDDYEYNLPDKKKSLSFAYTLVGISVVALLTLVVVFAANKDKNERYKNTYTQASTETVVPEKDDSYYISGETRVASDLDFWDDYDVKPEEEVVSVSVDEILDETEEDDPSTDGLHTRIVHEDGSEEWIEINKGLPLNDYNFDNLSFKKPFMQYQENNHIVSYEGVDISKTDDYVDFDALKNAGVDYVMIKLGQRGYSSGEISLDENFRDNITRAEEAGLNVGVYFFSQAISTEEAVEEANFVIASVSENSITYPVCYYIEPVTGVETRNDTISQMQRTNYAKTFLNIVKEAGYSPMIYGSKEWLIQKYSLGTLLNDGFDYWLSEEGDVPDYPYRFSMWRYTGSGSIRGISGYANLNISFVDYSSR